MRIAIRFGHALLKNGLKTSANGIINEYDTVREFGVHVVNALAKAGIDVVNVTPVSKKYIDGADDLQEGINTARATGCNVFISLHLNCTGKGTADGAEVLYNSKKSENVKLADSVQSELVKLGFKDRGLKERDNLAELNTSLTACIVEGFFVDSKIDVALYRKIGPEKFGQAIANGIIKHFKPSAVVKPVEMDKQYKVFGLLGNGLTEEYAKTKAKQLKQQGYKEIYYIKPDGTKIEL